MTLSLNRTTLLVAAGIFLAALLLLAALVWFHQPAHRDRIDVSPYENDMTEALVRELLHQEALRDAPVCFLGFGEGGTSPGSDFIARFADCQQPAVLALNASVAPGPSLVLEKHNGHAGLVIKIIQLHEIIPDDYDITVSLSNLPPGHDHVVYHVTNTAGNWLVIKRS